MMHAHFTLDGRPLCQCSAVAYAQRLSEAGNPSCMDKASRQLERATALANAFPDRIALVFAPCPHSDEGAKRGIAGAKSKGAMIGSHAGLIKKSFRAR